MKKKNIDRKEKLKKIGKIGLTIFNVLTGIWFFISLICIIIAACSGSINTSGNNNGGGNRIIKNVSSSLEGNVSEVARSKYELRDGGDIEVLYDRDIINDYSITGIQNYDSSLILTCYEDIDYSRQYHLFTRENHLRYFLANNSLNLHLNFACSIPQSEYFTSNVGNSIWGVSTSKVIGFSIEYSTYQDGFQKFRSDLKIVTNTGSYVCYVYICYYDSDHVLNEQFSPDLSQNGQRLNEFNKLFYGDLHFVMTNRNNSLRNGIFYFSEYSIHDIGVFFNSGQLLSNFNLFWDGLATYLAPNVVGIHGSGFSEYEEVVIKGIFTWGVDVFDAIYIKYRQVNTYVFDWVTRQMLFNPSTYSNQYDYFYIPWEIGVRSGSLGGYVYHKVCNLGVYWSSQNMYFLGIDSEQDFSSFVIRSLSGEYLYTYSGQTGFYFTLFYALKEQCAFINGFYYYIDPNGNVHTGLTSSAIGGDISSSYIGDVFKLINQILTSFTGFFGYYLLPGISIGLLFALPLIFTIILFVVKLFKR